MWVVSTLEGVESSRTASIVLCRAPRKSDLFHSNAKGYFTALHARRSKWSGAGLSELAAGGCAAVDPERMNKYK